MQTHLKGFGLENFRVFKDYTWFDFAPITILTGPNSSGKSSLNKALLLMKDNFEKKNLPAYSISKDYNVNGDEEEFRLKIEALYKIGAKYASFKKLKEEYSYFEKYKSSSLVFDAKIHGLNNAKNTKCRHSESNTLTFNIPYEISVIDKTASKLQGSNRPPKDIIIPLIYTLKFDINNNAVTESKLHIKNIQHKDILKITEYEIYFNVELFNKTLLNNEISIGSDLSSEYSKKISLPYRFNLSDWFQENNVAKNEAFNLSKLVFDSLNINNESRIEHAPYNDEEIENTFNSEGNLLINFKVNNFFNSLNILSSNKTEQKRVYTEEIDSHFKKQIETLYNNKIEGIPIGEFINKWSKNLGINGTFDIRFDSDMQTYFPNIGGVSLLDYGFGYSQIASLLFKIEAIHSEDFEEEEDEVWRMRNPDKILILEEPEANLHPNYQSMLANIIVDAAEKYKIQFIIETHSEYLIRKLQYLTAKKMIKPSDSVIYYFHHPDNVPIGEKQVKKIEILDDGSLSKDFGAGFFDEADNIAISLFNLKNRNN